MQLEAEQKTDLKAREIKKLKEWQGANFLISLTYVFCLLASCFIGTWGLVSQTPGELKLFPQVFITYVFSKLIPHMWLQASLLIFICLGFCFALIHPLDINFGYFFGLNVALLIITKQRWTFWILAPIAVHTFGILYVAALEHLSIEGAFELVDYLNKVIALSKDSLLFELLFVYPLIFLSMQLNKVLNIFRILE